MLNRIIAFSLRNRVAILLMTAAICIWGCIEAMRAEIDIFPDLNAPTVTVMTEAPGMAPEEIEQLISYPIETALNGATDVRRVRSASSTGFSVVWAEFEWDADPYRARQIVSEKLSEISDRLPSNAGVPTMGPQSSILGEMMIIGLRADSTDLMTLRTIADRTLRPRLLSLGGVAQVAVLGGDVAEYQILLNPEKMRLYGVSIDDVKAATEDFNTNRAGDVIYDFSNEYLVKASMHTTNCEELEKAVVKPAEGDGPAVTLADISRVVIGAETPRLGVASVNTRPAVLLTVTKQPATSTVDLTQAIDRMLSEEKASLPGDVKIDTDIFRQSDFIETSVGNLQQSLIEGAFFVIVVLFLFLMNFRTTVISIVAIPLSVLVTIILFKWMGLTINTMSLGGIAIAIGSLVDDAIVDVENVYRRIRENSRLAKDERKSVIETVYEASREVRLPILNSTLIIAASYIPLFFLDGIGGRMLIPLGVAFVTALVASTLVALTVTPVLCSYMLAGEGSGVKGVREPWVSRQLGCLYRASLASVLHHRKAVLIATGVLLLGAIAGGMSLGRSFLPPFNEGSLTINVATVPGISIEESDRLGREAEKIILEMPEISRVARKTGRAELDEHSLGANMSEIEAPYKLDKRSREEMVGELRHKLSALPGTTVEIGQPISHRIDAMVSGTEAQIAVKIFGPDLEMLNSLAHRVEAAMKGVDGLVDINVEQQSQRPQIDIKPRRDMLARYGIRNGSFSDAVATMSAGQSVGTVYGADGIPYDVKMKMDRKVHGDSSSHGSLLLSDLQDVVLESANGPVTLGNVAEIVSTSGPNTVRRENAQRRIVVGANVDSRDLHSAVSELQEAVAQSVALPEGYHVVYGGQFESEQESSRTLLLMSVLSLVVIFLLLMGDYRNIAQTLTILLNMPLALIGGVAILLLTGNNLNIPAVIGFISLMGIATRGGMLLMSHYNSLESEGVSKEETVIRGSADRFNPIVMTALTSALALLPLALRGGEPGNEIQSPMALVILGGLVSSTLLNLYVVPVVYSLIKRK